MSGKLIPHIRRTQPPGIPGIDSSDLFYGSWHFLNQALSCFLNSENYACITCLTASVELWLKRKLESNKKLQKLIDRAEDVNLISNKEKKMLHELRKIRNAYLHFDLRKLPTFKKKAKTLKLDKQKMFLSSSEIDQLADLKGEEISVYPDISFYDANPLAILPVHAYLYLNSVTDFFRKRYPKNNALIDSYFRFSLKEIEGLPENKVFLKLRILRRPKSKLEMFLSFLKRKLS